MATSTKKDVKKAAKKTTAKSATATAKTARRRSGAKAAAKPSRTAKAAPVSKAEPVPNAENEDIGALKSVIDTALNSKVMESAKSTMQSLDEQYKKLEVAAQEKVKDMRKSVSKEWATGKPMEKAKKVLKKTASKVEEILTPTTGKNGDAKKAAKAE